MTAGDIGRCIGDPSNDALAAKPDGFGASVPRYRNCRRTFAFCGASRTSIGEQLARGGFFCGTFWHLLIYIGFSVYAAQRTRLEICRQALLEVTRSRCTSCPARAGPIANVLSPDSNPGQADSFEGRGYFMVKKRSITSLFAVAMFFGGGSTVSAAEAPVHLNVNGVALTGQKPIIINQTTMVPIRTVSLLPMFSVDWDNQTKTVSVMNTISRETLTLTVGNKEAVRGTEPLVVDVPPRNMNGSVYVPLRFIGESLGAFVTWDAETRTAVMYAVSANPAIHSHSTVEARQAVLDLPKISLREHLGFTTDVRTTGYYFPYGQTQKFFIAEGDYIRYYEVQNGAAWQTWEGHIATKQADEPDAIANLVPAVSEEWGTRPTFSGSYVYFSHQWMAGVVNYGWVDENGTGAELGSLHGAFDKLTVVVIEGEDRRD